MKTKINNKLNYKIISYHLLLFLAFPLFLYRQYGEVNLKKTLLASILILISLILLIIGARKRQVIAKADDWISSMIASFISLVLSTIIFGYPIAWIIQRI
jgi:chromate transport protein ChrA